MRTPSPTRDPPVGQSRRKGVALGVTGDTPPRTKLKVEPASIAAVDDFRIQPVKVESVKSEKKAKSVTMTVTLYFRIVYSEKRVAALKKGESVTDE